MRRRSRLFGIISNNRSLEAGVFDCIIKPVQLIEFQSALTAAWEKWVEQAQILLKQNNNHKTPHVLFVEDVPMILALHQRFLIDLGCTVETAEDGRQVLSKQIRNVRF